MLCFFATEETKKCSCNCLQIGKKERLRFKKCQPCKTFKEDLIFLRHWPYDHEPTDQVHHEKNRISNLTNTINKPSSSLENQQVKACWGQENMLFTIQQCFIQAISLPTTLSQ